MTPPKTILFGGFGFIFGATIGWYGFEGVQTTFIWTLSATLVGGFIGYLIDSR